VGILSYGMTPNSTLKLNIGYGLVFVKCAGDGSSLLYLVYNRTVKKIDGGTDNSVTISKPSEYEMTIIALKTLRVIILG